MVTDQEAAEIAKSVLSRLPDNAFTNFLESINDKMFALFSPYLPEEGIITTILANPLIILLLIFIILALVAFSADFFADAWKIPIAILIDIIDLMALTSGLYLDIVAAAGSLIMFFLLTGDCNKPLHYSFTVLGPLKCILPFPILAILPINTVLMMVAAVADRGI